MSDRALNNRHIRAVVFDFDYTLADSSRGIIECVNYAFGKLGLVLATEADIRRSIGLALPEVFERLAGEQGASQAAEFSRLFIERADQVMVDETHLLPEVPDAVAALRLRGLALGIVSTKFRHRIEAVLGREGLLESFRVIVGGEDVPDHKPDPKGLLAALRRLGVGLTGAVYVGDSVTDAETAARAGVSFFAVLSGVTRREEFSGHPVRAVLDSLRDLPSVVL